MKNIDNLYIFILILPAIQISTFLAQLSRLHNLQKIFSYGTALFKLNILHKTQYCINDLVQKVPRSSHWSINSKGKETVKDYEEKECNLLVSSSGTGLEKNCWVHHPPTGLLRTVHMYCMGIFKHAWPTNRFVGLGGFLLEPDSPA